MCSEAIALLLESVQARFGHSCAWVKSVLIEIHFKERCLWRGEVAVVSLHDHPAAAECFAWLATEEVEPVIVLRQPPIDTPEDAVKAHILGRCAVPADAL